MKASHKILQDLIAFPSVSGAYEPNHQAIEYIDAFLSERGMFVERFTFNGFESLVATTQRTKTPTVMLYGHIDVVPGEDHQFALREHDGKFFGRGVLDMKAGIAAYLQLVDDFQGSLDQYDLGIMIVSDEEVGGYAGTVPLLEAGYVPKMCVMPDGGGNWALETFSKGLWIFDVGGSGSPAHGSRPWEGKNAIDTVLQAVSEVKALFPAPARNTSTCTFARFQGGEAVNQVPGSATASLDMRFASIEDEKNIMTAAKHIFETYGLEVQNEVYSAPTVNDPENHYLKSFARSLEKTLGYPVGTTISLGAGDGRFMAAQGIPCAVFYPEGGGHHSPEEWIGVDAYHQLQAVLSDYIRKEARVPIARFATRTRELEPVA